MTPMLSSNTKAILLLTSPLMAGQSPKSSDLLTPAEYRRLAKQLRDIGREPADLLTGSFAEIAQACTAAVSPDRLKTLVGRGFQLSQAVERWQARAIWVISRADPEYPGLLKSRLRNDAPAILYGCGDVAALNRGGLAVVGSRAADEALLSYTLTIGELSARAGRAVISGGAKGIDQYAMRGALNAGGRVIGVLADSLERQAMNRDHRNRIVDGQLTLVSPFDPGAGFHVGNAMQRNKTIYALSDAALVVSTDLGKGGTWTGAVEQLDKFRCVPIYVRSAGEPQAGLAALKTKGAFDWPNLADADALDALLSAPDQNFARSEPSLFEVPVPDTATSFPDAERPEVVSPEPVGIASAALGGVQSATTSPADSIFQAARAAIETLLAKSMTETEVATELLLSPAQTKSWLARLVDEGIVEKTKKPVKYRLKAKKLFD
jgi:predicted Rossmann fold nucleotide-binding protein DprA/Smf involved in DNA uptake